MKLQLNFVYCVGGSPPIPSRASSSRGIYSAIVTGARVARLVPALQGATRGSARQPEDAHEGY